MKQLFMNMVHVFIWDTAMHSSDKGFEFFLKSFVRLDPVDLTPSTAVYSKIEP